MRQRLTGDKGIVAQGFLVAGVFVAFLSLAGLLATKSGVEPLADMYIEPTQKAVVEGDTFVVSVMVDARTPVNVFKGEVTFDNSILWVESIDYNTSIADLWAELPWYGNGEGRVTFAGGTTRPGGFLGTGSLITITFRTTARGATLLRLEGARILEHNGLGTDVPLSTPIDALFNVEEAVIASETVSSPETTTAALVVTPEKPSTDVNGDGKQTLSDISIFMLNILGNNMRFDFNQDGSVDTKDMSIIMGAR